MKRWHAERHIAEREWRKHRRMHVQSNIDYQRVIGADPFKVDCVCDEQIGRFRKKDAHDCGKPRCMICHSEKIMGTPKIEEILADLNFKEQLEELGDV